jgi:protein TonB
VGRASSYDDPWQRLSWIGPASFLLSVAALYGFLRLTLGQPPAPPKPQPVSVSIVELPPPAAPAPQPEQPAEVEPPKPEPSPEIKRPPPRPATRAPAPAHPSENPPPNPPPVPATPQNAPAPSGGTLSARAIYKPMPEIPDEVRRHAVDLVAVARFHVHVDGKADFELVQPTPIPALNSALLDKLKTWRFFPALTDGKPVDSTIDLRIPITVKP